ncbi:hydroxyacid dehydrogenase, partial [Frankia sp. CN4]|nr:hydroxyacid dehydrogenase [Frankia nepalensis]
MGGRPVGDGDGRPAVVVRPAPRRHDDLFAAEVWAELAERFRIIDLTGDDPAADEAALEAALPEVFAIVGQPDLPRERVARAPRLRAVLNVEGNFLPNEDYEACFERGIHVLAAGPAFAQPVAEYALGLALDLARGISREDRAFRAGEEGRVPYGGGQGVLLRHADVGLVGFGNLGRALHPLLAPFQPTIRVFDPWLPPSVLRERGLVPAPLDETVARSQFLFVLATATAENHHLLGPRELALAPPGARLVLVSPAPGGAE